MILAQKRKLKVQEVADQLRRHIESGVIPPDSSIASARELSSELNIPLSTINRAVYQLVEEGWLYRQHGRGTFVKSHEKKSISWRIGFYERIDEPLFTDERYYIQSLYEKPVLAELEKMNCQVKRFGRNNLESPKHCAETFPHLDAIIVNSALINPQTESNLYRFGKPILIYRNLYIRDFPSNQVIPDWSMGIRQMLDQIDLNRYRRFLLLKFRHVNNDMIANTFCLQAALYGIKPEQIEITEFEYNLTFNEQFSGLKFGLTMKPQPGTFIFSTSDFLAFGLVDAWRERGIPLGEYPLVGCFNMEGYGWLPFDTPMITSLHLDRDELARHGTRLLKEALENGNSCPQIVKIPTQLIIRKTAFA